MSLIKLYKKINEIKNNSLKDIPISTHSTLSVSDNTIEFEVNGTPSSILINFSGTGRFVSKMPITIKTKIGKTAILISNLFREDIPKVILEYAGNISIDNCFVMNFDGSKIRATVNNNQEEELLNKAKTNMEDDTLVLYDTPKRATERPFKSGAIKPRINTSLINEFGKVQKVGKPDIERISTAIETLIPVGDRRIRYQISRRLEDSPQLPITDLPITDLPITDLQTTADLGISNIQSIEQSFNVVEYEGDD